MKKNIHERERVVRFFGGLFLVSFSLWGPKNAWFLLGLVPMLTGFTGVCPLYSLRNMSTRNEDKKLDIKGHRYFHYLK
jgi:hypothetical protein